MTRAGSDKAAATDAGTADAGTADAATRDTATGAGAGSRSTATRRRAPRSAPRAPARHAVVVLSMHRSGSSALSRVLNLVGCTMPETLMGGDASNRSGHWESTVVRALDEDILASAGSEWQDWQAFNPGWYDSQRPAEFRARAAEVLAGEYGDATLIAFKDPRVCRFFPFWDAALEAAGYARFVLLPVRQPVEVAASLQARNGLSEMHGLLLWLRHVLAAERDTRHLPRCVITYDQLLERPEQTIETLGDRLGLAWPSLSEKVRREIADYVSPQQRHHTADTGDRRQMLGLSDWLGEVYDILAGWAATGEEGAGDRDRLDRIATEFDMAQRPLAEAVSILSRQSESLREKDKELGYLRGEAGKRGERIKVLEDEMKATAQEYRNVLDTYARIETETAPDPADQEHVASLEADLERQTEELGQVARLVQQNAAERDARAREVGEAREQLEALKARLDRQIDRTAAIESAKSAREARHAEELRTLTGRLEGLEAELTQARHDLAQTRRHLEQRRAEAEETAGELARARAAAEARDAEIARERTAREAEVADEARSREEAHARARAEGERALAAARSRIGELDQDIEVRYRELAELGQSIIAKEEAAKALRAETAGLRDDLARRDRQIAELEAQRTDLLTSTSWRITGPLRRISRAISRLRT